MNLVSLLILPGHHHPAATTPGPGLAIAGVALVVLLVAIAFSKRKTDSMDSELPACNRRAARCGRLTGSAGPPVADPANPSRAAGEPVPERGIPTGALGPRWRVTGVDKPRTYR